MSSTDIHEKQLVFVYGTLRKGGRLHTYLEDCECIATGTTVNGQLFHVRGGSFPVARKGAGTIVGEVYTATPATLAQLDRVEGHPFFYERELAEINVGDAKFNFDSTPGRGHAWIYWGTNVPVGNRIADGDWIAETTRAHS